MTAPPASELHFRPASDTEKQLCWARNAASWSGALANHPMSVYLQREVINGINAGAPKDITYWVLSTSVTPTNDSGAILAACESLRRAALVGKEIEDAFGIASVYTHPEYRGQGLARILLERMAEWIDQNAKMSALWSDVGKTFYNERGGWEPFISTHVIVRLKAPAATSSNTAVLLKKDDIKAVCEDDIAALQASAGPHDFSFLPSYKLACWHFGAEEHIGSNVANRIPEIKGARKGKAAMYWTHDFNDKKILVLRLIEGDGADVEALWKAAAKEAENWGFEKVVAWNPSDAIVEAARRADVGDVEVQRKENDSIPSLRWRGAAEGETNWRANERYSWC